jgi:tRNA threonylcarbamoyladenosine biosynthesis protein TsaE
MSELKTTVVELQLPDSASTEACGEALAKHCTVPGIIYLSGELGAGKTTFTRGFLRGLGMMSDVKSPTYTLVESYPIPQQKDHIVHHFDLYRLNGPEELEMLGLRDYTTPNALCLVEWPERGFQYFVATPDLHCYLDYVEKGRTLRMIAYTRSAKTWLARFNNT